MVMRSNQILIRITMQLVIANYSLDVPLFNTADFLRPIHTINSSLPFSYAPQGSMFATITVSIFL